MNGQRETLTEYQIAVEGLGLPAGYAPGEDSTVRNRAYTLRRKVNEIYRTELAGAPVRIEFMKSSYLPRFVSAVPEPLVTAIIPRAVLARKREMRPWLAFGLGMVVAGSSFGGWTATRGTGVDPVLHEAWGPLLSPETNALICGNDDPADAGAEDQGPRDVEAAGESAGAGSTAERGGLGCEAAARSGGQQDLSVAYDELGGFGGCAGSGGRGTVASDSEAAVH